MANQEQLEILKQGVEVWNSWKDDNPNIEIDLRGANLAKADLSNANFFQADLSEANLHEANLTRSNLMFAEINYADISGANLSEIISQDTGFEGANLRKATLWKANLDSAELVRADLTEANFTGANLSTATLWEASFTRTVLNNANFENCDLAFTLILDVDLRVCLNLQTTNHDAPSYMDMSTIQISRGKIPAEFLRGCGLSDWEIEYARLYNSELSDDEIGEIFDRAHQLRVQQPQQTSDLFISYSHIDGAFVRKLEGSLKNKGIRYWRDTHEMKAGRIEKQIDRAIRHNPIVLLVLSENSIKSDWVEHEIRTAKELEKELGQDTLCPVALDESWKDSPWPKRVMEQVMEYNILDFSEWEDDVKFEGCSAG